MLTNIGLTILLWVFYYFIHSLLANKKVKLLLIEKFHSSVNIYRLVYSIISILGLISIFYFLSSTKSDILLEKTQTLKFISLALSTWGVIIIKLAFKNYSIRQFLGLSKTSDQSTLLELGIFRYVRHPIYSGTILLFLGFWLFIPNVLNLATVLCMFLYLPLGIRMEEDKLIGEFGVSYQTYKEKVPALFPDLRNIFRSYQR
jgi:methanethiol S-methyltransferase